jgi:RHS repeat-associated protein
LVLNTPYPQHPGTLASALSYNAAGAIAQMTYGNGLVQTVVMNNRLQPCRINVKSSGTAPAQCGDAQPSGNFQDFAYTFTDAQRRNNGNVQSWVGTGQQGFTRSYTYDELNRIKTAQSAAASGGDCWGLQFGYDIWANLLSATTTKCAPPNLNVTVSTLNRITNTGFTYDAAGNLTADGSFTYQWDAEGQMKSLNTSSVLYTYDGDGRRVKKSTGKLYWNDVSGNTVVETDLAGNNPDEYIFFGGKRIARRQSSGTVHYYFADHLGSSRVVTNATGTILDDSDYYPFGGERVVASSSGNRYKFTGKERDSESTLDYFGARYYSSQQGRFLSPDEFTGGPVDAFSSSDPLPPGPLPYAQIVEPQSLNKYAYAYNNPLRFTDPDGHCPVCVVIIWVAIETAATAYDAYDTYKTLNDPNASEIEMQLATSGFVAGLALPGGGYGTGSKSVYRIGNRVVDSIEFGKHIGGIFKKVDNILTKNLDDATISAAQRELKGEVVAVNQKTGKAFDHVRKVREAAQGLANQGNEIKKLLQDPAISQKLRAELEAKLRQVNKKLDELKQAGLI